MIAFISISLAVYLADLLSKGVIRSSVPLGAEIKLLPVFSITHVQNTGIAFGLFPDKNFFFVGVGLLMTVLLIALAKRAFRESRATAYILAIVLGGAWGNLTDRLLYGRVTDFLDFFVGVHHWPAFNVADSAICVGAGLLVLQNLRRVS